MKKSTLSNMLNTDFVQEDYVQTSENKKDFITNISELFTKSPKEADKYVTTILDELYGRSVARAFKFLFDNVDLKVKMRFANTYMSPETLAYNVTSDIAIKATSPADRQTPNIGRYVITVCSSDGREQQLHFTNQVSTVYFLMYLIDRKQKFGNLPVIDLSRNKSTFVSLYHAVYDKISHSAAQLRHQQLLYRVVNGKIRAGYKAKIECDIRHQLTVVLSEFGDSPVPYGMGSHRHLTINPDKISFIGEARRLLYLEFT